jgi:hypothetical protein
VKQQIYIAAWGMHIHLEEDIYAFVQEQSAICGVPMETYLEEVFGDVFKGAQENVQMLSEMQR